VSVVPSPAKAIPMAASVMSLLFIAASVGLGGGERFAERLSLRVQERGISADSTGLRYFCPKTSGRGKRNHGKKRSPFRQFYTPHQEKLIYMYGRQKKALL
jgi:hypothetical protein